MSHPKSIRKYSLLEIEAIRKKKIGQIKIAQKQLNLDDDTYRSLLMRVTDQNSCSKLNLAQLNCVIDELVEKGFKIVSKRGSALRPQMTLEAMINKIGAILAEQNLHWNYAHTIARKKFGVDQVHWLTAKQCHSVVASLQIYANRQNFKKGQGD